MSKQEEFLRKEIQNIFFDHQFIFNWRPDFLKNPNTGKNLELDIYIGRYKTAFEFQGGVHFKNIARYNNDSDKIREYDLLKQQLIFNSEKKQTALIEVFDTDLKGSVRENLNLRINNTYNLYLKRGLFYTCSNLKKMMFFLETGIKYRRKNEYLIIEEYVDQVNSLIKLETVKKYSIYTNVKADNIKNYMVSMGLEKYIDTFFQYKYSLPFTEKVAKRIRVRKKIKKIVNG